MCKIFHLVNVSSTSFFKDFPVYFYAFGNNSVSRNGLSSEMGTILILKSKS